MLAIEVAMPNSTSKRPGWAGVAILCGVVAFVLYLQSDVSLGLPSPLLRAPSLIMSCSGEGSARGHYGEVNFGELDLDYAVVSASEGGHVVIFSDDPTVAAAMRSSPEPETEGPLAAAIFGRRLLGVRFDGDGEAFEFLERSNSWKWDGSGNFAQGQVRIDRHGCARGGVRIARHGVGRFAVPLHGPQGLVSQERSQAGSHPESRDADPLALWSEAHARLMDPDAVTAIQALGFSEPAAAVLAEDPRMAAVLKRMRTQCTDPAQARFDGFGDIEGRSPSDNGVVFRSQVKARATVSGAVIDRCSVMERTFGELWNQTDQCWPLMEDCSVVPVSADYPKVTLADEFDIAIEDSNVWAVQKLLKAGHEADTTGWKGDWTPLMIAAWRYETEIAERLIDAGADVNAKAASGVTPLYLASQRGSTEVVAVLLRAGADANVEGPGGRTALGIARTDHRDDIIGMLEAAGAR
ncbi:MAG: ankyrin repeat domain-containing protein [Sinimarinibacterium sp.]